jgi:hypothetical protein
MQGIAKLYLTVFFFNTLQISISGCLVSCMTWEGYIAWSHPNNQKYKQTHILIYIGFLF